MNIIWQTSSPERVGTYRVKDSADNIGFAYWTGLHWGNFVRRFENAWQCRFEKSCDVAAWSGNIVGGPLELTQEVLS